MRFFEGEHETLSRMATKVTPGVLGHAEQSINASGLLARKCEHVVLVIVR